ncbi:hypothetical protein MSAN_02291900 [Mycena sanguinolenta]|uniref:Uncharacterized protein n=1 Tax=Mycena sanguinolenta TaxID=230812 RepID=A0A8H7CHX6_9AGAR|nr:hypothetical protein MSAN_02291900 [Mycena sanguinolenta]
MESSALLRIVALPVDRFVRDDQVWDYRLVDDQALPLELGTVHPLSAHGIFLGQATAAIVHSLWDGLDPTGLTLVEEQGPEQGIARRWLLLVLMPLRLLSPWDTSASILGTYIATFPDRWPPTQTLQLLAGPVQMSENPTASPSPSPTVLDRGPRPHYFPAERGRPVADVVVALWPPCKRCSERGVLCAIERDGTRGGPPPRSCATCRRLRQACEGWRGLHDAFIAKREGLLGGYKLERWNHVGAGSFLPMGPHPLCPDLAEKSREVSFRDLLRVLAAPCPPFCSGPLVLPRARGADVVDGDAMAGDAHSVPQLVPQPSSSRVAVEDGRFLGFRLRSVAPNASSATRKEYVDEIVSWAGSAEESWRLEAQLEVMSAVYEKARKELLRRRSRNDGKGKAGRGKVRRRRED